MSYQLIVLLFMSSVCLALPPKESSHPSKLSVISTFEVKQSLPKEKIFKLLLKENKDLADLYESYKKEAVNRTRGRADDIISQIVLQDLYIMTGTGTKPKTAISHFQSISIIALYVTFSITEHHARESGKGFFVIYKKSHVFAYDNIKDREVNSKRTISLLGFSESLDLKKLPLYIMPEEEK